MDAGVTVTFFTDFAAKTKREEVMTLGALAEIIQTTTAGDKTTLPWLKLARFGDKASEKDALRHDANVTSICGTEGDYDGETIGFYEAVEIARTAGLRAIIYTSPSHRPEKPRWRIICPTSAERPPGLRAKLISRLNGLYKGVFSAESWTLSQSYYYGAVKRNKAHHRVQVTEGLCIDQLDELDGVAIGKPNGSAGGGHGVARTAGGGGVNTEELEEAIVTGETYHVPCTRLAGYWKRLGVPLFDAHDRLVQLFDGVFPADRDDRWQGRRNDALRIVADIYKKDDAAAADDDPAPSPASPTSGPAWPAPIGDDARIGLIGDFLSIVAPHTEADPAALLFQFLTIAGCHLGNEAWYEVEGTRHAGRLFCVIVGRTSIARKGSALSQVRRVFDALWLRDHSASGLSSGEGLIERVRDRTTKVETDKKTGAQNVVEEDPGVDDKRLLVIEEEFARVLRVKAREQNTLPDVLRQAWDGHDLGVMTRKRALHATEPHICIVSHITTDELAIEMDDLSTANGLANRFLFCCAQRARVLPFGGSPDPVLLDALHKKLAHALNTAPRGAIGMDAAARALWEPVYRDIAGERHGLLGALTSRAAPQIMRVALIYALLDGSQDIGEDHLKAGIACWRYAENSARVAFRDRTGNPVADNLLAGLRDAGGAGLPKAKLFELLNRNVNAAGINTALCQLEEQGLAQKRTTPASKQGGRPAEFWVAI